ncbi:MAG: invasion associated locus B family protein [Pseudomonadota bacterium]
MRTSLFALVLALAAPTATWSQTTDTETNTEDTAPATSVEDQLSLGEPADETPQVGQSYVSEKIGDWDMRCIRTEDESDPCQMYQLMSDDEGTPVAEISIFRLPEGGRAVAGATIIVPLETSLPQQLTMAVDGGQARRYPYSFCNQIGCYARVGLTAEEVDAFKRGNSASLSLVPAVAPDQQVQLTMSLTGFTASFDKTAIVQQ